jgi:hypothetical protein
MGFRILSWEHPFEFRFQRLHLAVALSNFREEFRACAAHLLGRLAGVDLVEKALKLGFVGHGIPPKEEGGRMKDDGKRLVVLGVLHTSDKDRCEFVGFLL